MDFNHRFFVLFFSPHQELSFPLLYLKLDKLRSEGHHEVLSIILDEISYEVAELSVQKLPKIYTKAFFENNQELISKQINDYHHVGRNTRIGLEEALIEVVLKKTAKET